MRRSGRDRTKIIVLFAVLLLVWVVIGARYVLLSRQWQAKIAAAHHHPEAMATSPTSPGAPDQQPASPQTQARGAALLGLGPAPSRDPFRPVIPPRTSGLSSASAAPPEEQAAASLPLLPPPLPAELSSRGGEAASRITGIVLGNPSIAVLRRGDDHYVVRVGDSIGGHLRVQAITRSTVTLYDGKRTYELRMGQ